MPTTPSEASPPPAASSDGRAVGDRTPAADAAAAGVRQQADTPPTPGVVPTTRGTEPLLRITGLKKHFPIYGGLFRRQIGSVYASTASISTSSVERRLPWSGSRAAARRHSVGRSPAHRTDAGKIRFVSGISALTQDELRPVRRRMQIIFQDPFGR